MFYEYLVIIYETQKKKPILLQTTRAALLRRSVNRISEARSGGCRGRGGGIGGGGGGGGGVGWLESVTFFKASVRLKTEAVVPLIIYSQKIPCEEHIFKEMLAQNKTTSCEYLWQPHYTYLINGPLLNKEITP